MSSERWIQTIEDRLLALDGIESVYVAKDDRNVDVWTLIPKREPELIRQIAETEHTFMKEFVRGSAEPRMLFDFHVLYRGDQRAEDLVPRGAVRAARPAA